MAMASDAAMTVLTRIGIPPVSIEASPFPPAVQSAFLPILAPIPPYRPTALPSIFAPHDPRPIRLYDGESPQGRPAQPGDLEGDLPRLLPRRQDRGPRLQRGRQEHPPQDHGGGRQG